MSTTLNDILSMSELQQCVLLNPKVDCTKIVMGLDYLDGIDILPGMKSNTLLLVNACREKYNCADEIHSFLCKLSLQQVSGLFIKLPEGNNSFLDDISTSATELNLPLISVPSHYHWYYITDPIQGYLRQQQMRDIINTLGNKKQTVDDVCNSMACSFEKPVAIMDRRFRLLHASDHMEWCSITAWLNDPKSSIRRECFHLAQQTNNFRVNTPLGRLVFVPMPNLITHKYLAILLRGNIIDITADDTQKLDMLVVEIMLHIYREEERIQNKKFYFNRFLSDLINGMLVERTKVEEIASSLSFTIHDRYRIMVGFFNEIDDDNNILDELLYLIKKKNNSFSEVLVSRYNGEMIFFLPCSEADSMEIVKQVINVINGNFYNTLPRFGVSRLHTLEESSTAYEEAMFALSVKDFVNRQLISYDDLGLLRIFATKNNQVGMGYINELYQKTIFPLEEYDKSNSTQLVDTLFVYLKNECSIPITARQMFLHENTLRARLKRIECVSRHSLRNPMDITELVLGLEVKLLNK